LDRFIAIKEVRSQSILELLGFGIRMRERIVQLSTSKGGLYIFCFIFCGFTSLH